MNSDVFPLREPTFYILLSLAAGQKHGYAILKEVETLSQGRLQLSTGTLYEALARLLDAGLIQRVSTDPAAGDGVSDDTPPGVSAAASNSLHPGKPRKAYCLTHAGWQLLVEETKRLQEMVSAARQRLGWESL
jgi:DNA-binding PadR family transcriptional regulator